MAFYEIIKIGNPKSQVTAPVDRLQVNRLKEKTCAITQSQNRLEPLTGDWVMDDHDGPSVSSLNT
jgi:hypothetical protein